MSIRLYAIPSLTIAGVVWANAAATEYVCIHHHRLPICNSPQTPPHDFGHELPGSPYNPSINIGVSVTSSTTTAPSTGSIV
jgi:hypothetical protein